MLGRWQTSGQPSGGLEAERSETAIVSRWQTLSPGTWAAAAAAGERFRACLAPVAGVSFRRLKVFFQIRRLRKQRAPFADSSKRTSGCTGQPIASPSSRLLSYYDGGSCFMGT